jgi:site-specific recombinase XerD
MSDNTATQQPKLEARIREACRVRHYSLATERAYVLWYRQFVRWAGMKHPATLGGDRVEAWLSHLATERDVSASTQRQALAAILFLYKQVLGMAMPCERKWQTPLHYVASRQNTPTAGVV